MEMTTYLFSCFLIKNVSFELEKPNALSKHIYSLVPTRKCQKIHYSLHYDCYNNKNKREDGNHNLSNLSNASKDNNKSRATIQ